MESNFVLILLIPIKFHLFGASLYAKNLNVGILSIIYVNPKSILLINTEGKRWLVSNLSMHWKTLTNQKYNHTIF